MASMGKAPVASFTYTSDDKTQIANIAALLQAVKVFVNGGDTRIYLRGLSKSTHFLLPSIGRKHWYIGKPHMFTRENERQMLSRFRRHTYAHWNRILTEWEALFLGRHHDLPVRLMDWTSNPLVALYFASIFSDGSGGVPDGAVWAIQRRRDEANDLRILDDAPKPLEIPGIKLVYPFYPTTKMTVQSGLFTIQEDPWQPLENLAGRSYQDSDLDIVRMTKWIVPGSERQRIVEELDRLAINKRTLFPDLQGLSAGLWNSIIIRESR